MWLWTFDKKWGNIDFTLMYILCFKPFTYLLSTSIGGCILPKMEPEEERVGYAAKRNPKGELKFLLGAIDSRRQLMFMHTGRKLFAFFYLQKRY